MTAAPDRSAARRVLTARLLGYLCCAAGVALLLWADRQGPGARSPLGYAAVGLAAAGIVLLGYVSAQRLRYLRRISRD